MPPDISSSSNLPNGAVDPMLPAVEPAITVTPPTAAPTEANGPTAPAINPAAVAAVNDLPLVEHVAGDTVAAPTEAPTADFGTKEPSAAEPPPTAPPPAALPTPPAAPTDNPAAAIAVTAATTTELTRAAYQSAPSSITLPMPASSPLAHNDSERNDSERLAPHQIRPHRRRLHRARNWSLVVLVVAFVVIIVAALVVLYRNPYGHNYLVNNQLARWLQSLH